VNETDDEARPAARAVPDRALLTDAQWARLAPLLPPQQPKTGSGGHPGQGTIVIPAQPPAPAHGAGQVTSGAS